MAFDQQSITPEEFRAILASLQGQNLQVDAQGNITLPDGRTLQTSAAAGTQGSGFGMEQEYTGQPLNREIAGANGSFYGPNGAKGNLNQGLQQNADGSYSLGGDPRFISGDQSGAFLTPEFFSSLAVASPALAGVAGWAGAGGASGAGAAGSAFADNAVLAGGGGAVDAALGGAGADAAAGGAAAGGAGAGGAAAGGNWLSDALGSIPPQYVAPLAGAAIGGLAGSQDRTTTSTSSVDPATAAYQNEVRNRARQVADTPFTPYTGQRTAGLSTGQTQAGSALSTQVSGLPALRDQISGLINTATTPGTATKNPLADMNNPQLQAFIDASQADLSRSYAHTVAPKFSRASSYGNSGVNQSEVDSRNDLMRQLGLISTDARYKDYTNQQNLQESFATRQDATNASVRQAQLTGASQLGQLPNVGREVTNDLLNYGNIQQQTQQNGLNANYDDFLRQIGYPAQQLQALQSGVGSPTSQTQSQTTPGNLWTGLAGGAIVGSQLNRATTPTTSQSATPAATNPVTTEWNKWFGQSGNLNKQSQFSF